MMNDGKNQRLVQALIDAYLQNHDVSRVHELSTVALKMAQIIDLVVEICGIKLLIDNEKIDEEDLRRNRESWIAGVRD